MTYTFNAIAELDQVPLEKLDHMLVDLKAFLILRRQLRKLPTGVVSMKDHFIWIDDGQHSINIRCTLEPEAQKGSTT